MKGRWFFLFFKKSLSRRRGRVVMASFSVTLAVAVMTGMAGITSGIGEKLGSELKAYGANIIISPGEGGYIDYGRVNEISGLDSIASADGQVYASAGVAEQMVEVLGIDGDVLKDRGWRFSGERPEKKNEMLAGVNLKEVLDLDTGSVILLTTPLKKMQFAVTGFVETGGDADSSFIMSIQDAWELTGRHDKLDAVLVRSAAGKLEHAVGDIRSILPDLPVKTVRQVAFAEESLLNKIQLLMLLVTVVVLFTSVISGAGTMGANVLERREEIGLMMAIGATKKEISLFYTAEAVLIGLSGGVCGFLTGYLAAQLISKGAFDSYISVPWYIILLSIAGGLFISVVSGHFPVRNAMKQSPAVILRGE